MATDSATENSGSTQAAKACPDLLSFVPAQLRVEIQRDPLRSPGLYTRSWNILVYPLATPASEDTVLTISALLTI